MANKILERALAEREAFLKDRPHLREFQAELDTILDKVPEKQRLEVLAHIQYEKFRELNFEVNRLAELVQDCLKDVVKK